MLSSWNKDIIIIIIIIDETEFLLSLRARFPSIISSIKIELNVSRDKLSSITIEITFSVALRRGFKKPVQSSLISVTPGTKIF